MTGEDIITEARLNFGERTVLTLTDDEFKQWVNTSLRELYSLLPLAELEVLAETTSVALTDGRGDLPAELDHLLSAAVDGATAHPLALESISVISANPFFETFVPVFATDGERIWVRPADTASVEVTHIDPPATISTFSNEVVLPKWHAALVLFVTSFAYAQEEDKGQAQHYRNEALALINRTSVAPEQEAL